MAEVGGRSESHAGVGAGIFCCLLEVVCAHRCCGVFDDAEDVFYRGESVICSVDGSI